MNGFVHVATAYLASVLVLAALLKMASPAATRQALVALVTSRSDLRRWASPVARFGVHATVGVECVLGFTLIYARGALAVIAAAAAVGVFAIFFIVSIELKKLNKPCGCLGGSSSDRSTMVGPVRSGVLGSIAVAAFVAQVVGGARASRPSLVALIAAWILTAATVLVERVLLRRDSAGSAEDSVDATEVARPRSLRAPTAEREVDASSSSRRAFLGRVGAVMGSTLGLGLGVGAGPLSPLLMTAEASPKASAELPPPVRWIGHAGNKVTTVKLTSPWREKAGDVFYVETGDQVAIQVPRLKIQSRAWREGRWLRIEAGTIGQPPLARYRLEIPEESVTLDHCGTCEGVGLALSVAVCACCAVPLCSAYTCPFCGPGGDALSEIVCQPACSTPHPEPVPGLVADCMLACRGSCFFKHGAVSTGQECRCCLTEDPCGFPGPPQTIGGCTCGCY